jgi:hypothetical protein
MSLDDIEKPRNNKRNYWKAEEEILLKEWADKAQCYKWMHLKAHEQYKRKNALFTIPVIIISTMTGTANFAQDRFPEENKSTIVMAIGSLNIVAGIITTIYQFLKISEFNEAHRVASLSWDKFYRNLKTELTKNPLDRFAPYEMIKISKEEYDRLTEISPLIPNDIIDLFNKTFKKNEDVIRPDLCGELHGTSVYEISDEERSQLYTKPKVEKKITLKEKEKQQIIDKKLEKFRNTFFQLNQRYPTKEEIDEKFANIYDNHHDKHSNYNKNNFDYLHDPTDEFQPDNIVIDINDDDNHNISGSTIPLDELTQLNETSTSESLTSDDSNSSTKSSNV